MSLPLWRRLKRRKRIALAAPVPLARHRGCRRVLVDMTGTEEHAKAFILGMLGVYLDLSSSVRAQPKIGGTIPVKTIGGRVSAEKGGVMVTLQYVVCPGTT